MPQLGPVEYGFVIVGVVVSAIVLTARDRDEFRAHVRRLGGPLDPGPICPRVRNFSSTLPDGCSWYHSLQVMAEHRFRDGFTAQFNWVWSKFMEATAFQNATDPVPSPLDPGS